MPADTGPTNDRDAPPRRRRLPRGLAALRHRNYRLFFGGQLISVTGTWMQSLAQAWLVLSLTGSPFYFALVNVFQFAPILFLSFAGGVIADRFPKRSVLLTTQSVAGLLAATLAVLAATGTVQLWHVYTLALGLGVVNAFDMPARQAFVAEMVDSDDLGNAIALNSSLFNSARIVGPALAGLLLAAFGPAVCFAINAASYVAVIAGLAAMRLGPAVTARAGSGLQRMREGLTYVGATPPILMPISLIALVAIFGLNFNIWIPLLAKDEFELGAGGFGMLMSALGVGSLAGALFLAFSGRGPRPRLILVTAAMLGVAELALATAASVPTSALTAVVILAVMGFAMSTTNAMANTIVQTVSPREMRGRVMSVYMFFFVGTAPVGGLLAGITADRFGTPTSLALGGAITLVAALAVAVRFGAWRPDAEALRVGLPAIVDGATRPLAAGRRD